MTHREKARGLDRDYISLMRKILSLLALSASFSLLSCERPPEQCREEINVPTAPSALSAWNELEKLHTDGLVRFDFPSKPTSEQAMRLGQLLQARATGDDADSVSIDLAFLESEAHKIAALKTKDKHFFFSYNTTTHKGFDVLQLSISWRVGMEASNTQKFEVTKTGYYDEDGKLLCFWTHTPRL